MKLSGRVALVTGAGRRLGRTIARAIAGAGAHLAIHHHSSPAQAEELREEVHSLGVRAEIFQADLTDPSQIEKLFSDLDRAFGRLDVLVNSAAAFQRKPLLEIKVEDWDHVLNLNLRAPFLCAQQAAHRMRAVGGGAIVNIADVGALQPWSGYAHHSISKAGLVMATRVLARALAPQIRVNAVAPGPVLPPDDLTDLERQELAEMTALKRLGTPEDVAGAVLFLIESEYITGEVIVVDGGKMLLT